ncbi:SnoaL-like domain-containing protein [Ilyonectria robusta]|uniref:SnoaL-like domain-containing protein n=1 Tax=Ilyonectria robusta TaxID=1079257 RepID=UPI001E8E1AF7|nr:SnoaL-like domain-containing protein [Ilyonectria robusta]KAH8651760.1 SnoaL-like domain-containing protein [Ilyonectria robusta]
MVQATSDHELIRNSIARYCIGVDLKDWKTFSNAFLDNAKVTFPGPGGTIEGATAIKAAVQGMVGNLQTQHALTTQLIEVTSEITANATTYCRAEIFGVGEDEGKRVTNWGIYQDKLLKGTFDGQEDWKIAERNAIRTAPLAGDLSLIGM